MRLLRPLKCGPSNNSRSHAAKPLKIRTAVEKKQSPQTRLAADPDLPDAERDGPDEIGVEDRAPIGDPRIDGSGRVQNLDQQQEQECQRGKDKERSSCILPADREPPRCA